MSPRAKSPTPDELAKHWKEVVGRHPHNVQIVERSEKGFEIFLRYSDPAKVTAGARDARTWKSTGLTARTSLTAKWNEDIRTRCRMLAATLELDLRNGRVGGKAELPEADVAVQQVLVPAALSLRDGIIMATALDGTGMVSAPLVDGVRAPGRVTKEIITRSRTMLRVWTQFALKTGKPIPTWNDFTPVDAVYVVRTLADEHVASGRHGFTVAMKMIDELYRMARWLKDKREIDSEACKPREKWKVSARKEWELIADKIEDPNQPRFSEPEMHALFSALDDPRGCLAMLFHHGVRLSLFAARCRSHLSLECTAMRPHGGIMVREAPGNEYVRRLTSEQRAFLDDALSNGYLRRYEAARAAGSIVDFPLFAAGRLIMLPSESAELAPALAVDTSATSLSVDEKNVITIDPRNRLAVELGAALRLGQFYETRRSQVDMDAFFFMTDDANFLAQRVGTVDVLGAGNKQSPGIALNSVTRKALELALAGYLSEFEALYLAGEIDDYSLFPAGRLDKGIAKPAGKHSHMAATRDAGLGWFHDLEEAAGVVPVKGRGWNGLRRTLMDSAPKFTENEMTLNTLAGTSTAMRNGVYQSRESLESRIDAANTYERIRTNGRLSGTTPAPNPLLLNAALAKALSIYSADEIRSMIAQMDAQRAERTATLNEQDVAVNPDENAYLVDPPVDPNAKARVHDGNPGLAEADRRTT